MTVIVSITHKSGNVPVYITTSASPSPMTLRPSQTLDVTMWAANDITITEVLAVPAPPPAPTVVPDPIVEVTIPDPTPQPERIVITPPVVSTVDSSTQVESTTDNIVDTFSVEVPKATE